MIKNKKMFALLFVHAFLAHAGTMGPADLPSTGAFIAGEGGYTWNKNKGTDVNLLGIESLTSHFNNQGGSGRLSIGLLKYLRDSYGMSAELGWGYYGSSKVTLQQTGPAILPAATDFGGYTTKSSYDGLDLLVGLVYQQPSFGLFAKVGALMENVHFRNQADLADLTGGIMTGNINSRENRTEALPELKLGLSYRLLSRLSLIGSWSHAFGSSPHLGVSLNPGPSLIAINQNQKNPTLDIALLGLQYDI